jgi:transketolase
MDILKNKILSISFRLQAPHIGSNITAIEIIDEMFKKKLENDIIIISAGHYALAYYVYLEHIYKEINAEEMYKNIGGHPHLDESKYIYASSGSLGLGICIAVGRAFYNKNRNVYVLISDGECAEGSVWESLKFIQENNMKNIHIYVNVNGYSAYGNIDTTYLENRLKSFLPEIQIRYTNVNQYPFLIGLNAHYHIIKEKDKNDFQYIE